MRATDWEAVRVTFEVRGRTSDIEVAPGLQTAQVEDNPDQHVVIGGAQPFQAANGVKYPTQIDDVSASTKGKQLVRPGWVTKNTSLSALHFARVAGVFEVWESW
jgi:hypothetical protein